MNKPVAIVTGASSGIGWVTCQELARSGFQVKAMVRNLAKVPDLKDFLDKIGLQNDIEFFPLDVTSKESISHFQQLLVEELSNIDVLVNNAGFASAGFSEEIPIEEYQKQFDTNFFGLIAVTQAVLPKMRKQGYGKIFNMSSISGKIGYPSLSPYVSSKFAVEGYSESLRLEVKPFGIDVVLIEPGSFQTNIWSTGNHVTQRSREQTSPYYSYMKNIEGVMEKGRERFGNPEDIAKLITRLALQKGVKKLRYCVGKSVRTTIILKSIIPWFLWEKLFFKKLL
ncbi:SDR family oxidoreductase [Neobacillus sp. D3-1R]|uniref:SDR family oxidoreductase n=1 Tax=Neobacillus sp. D3-1R TaxID=3445778 RepID=UPI003FA179D4